MPDEGYGYLEEDQTVILKTDGGRSITWRPRPEAVWPLWHQAPTPNNSLTDISDLNNFPKYSEAGDKPRGSAEELYSEDGRASQSRKQKGGATWGLLSRLTGLRSKDLGGSKPSQESDPAEGGLSKIRSVKIRHNDWSKAKRQEDKSGSIHQLFAKLTRWKQRFTIRLRSLKRTSLRRSRKTITHKTRLDRNTSTTTTHIALQIKISKPSTMDRMRGFWKPAPTANSTGESSSRRSRFKSRDMEGDNMKDSQTSHTNNIETTSGFFARSNRQALNSDRLANGGGSYHETVDTKWQQPSALDCARTENSRQIEQQAHELIKSSLSTVNEETKGESTKSGDKHKCRNRHCLCKQSKFAPDEDNTGQGAGNLGTPPDAGLLTTYDDLEESLVHVEMDGPIVDDSLMSRKIWDLRALDAALLKEGQQSATTASIIGLTSAFADEDESEEEIFIMDPSAPRARLHNPKTIPKKPTIVHQDPVIVKQRQRLEKVLGSKPDNDFILRAYNAMDVMKDGDNFAKKGKKPGEANTAVNSNSIVNGSKAINRRTAVNGNARLKKGEAAQTLKLPMEKKHFPSSSSNQFRLNHNSIEGLESSYIKIRDDESFKNRNPENICVAHPLLDDYDENEAKDETSSLKIGSYPDLESSATSTEFGFQPTLESMSESLPNESEYVTDFDNGLDQVTEAENKKTWRDFSVADLQMGRPDTYMQPLQRNAGNSCGAQHECGSKDSVCSLCAMKAHLST